MKKKLFMPTVIVLLVTLLFSACSFQKKAEDNTTPEATFARTDLIPIKVGVVGPFTGASEGIGKEMKAAVEMAFEPIDYRVGNYKIEMVYIDSQDDDKKLAAAYESAIVNDKIVAGFMDFFPNETGVCIELAAEYQIPHFFAIGSSQRINDKIKQMPKKYKYWVGNGWPLSSELATSYTNVLSEAIEQRTWIPSSKNFAIIGSEEEWSLQFGEQMRLALVREQWFQGYKKFTPMGVGDFTSIINDIKERDISLIAGTISDANDRAIFLKQLKEQNVPAVVIMDGIGWSSEWYKELGDSSNFVLDQIPQFRGKRSESFITQFTSKYGYAPSAAVGGLVFDWSNYFIKVMQTTLEFYKTIDSNTLMQCAEERLKTGNLTFVSGTTQDEFKFVEKGFPDMVFGPGYYIFPVVQYVDGKMETVWPENLSTSTFKRPTVSQ